MKIIVTGGAGFLGTHVAKALKKEKHSVLVVDDYRTGIRREQVKGVNYLEEDFGNEAALEAIRVFAPKVIVHLAAQTSVHVSVEDPLKDAAVNIISSLKILELAKELNVRFVFASSGGAIVGDAPILPTPELDQVTPISPYGISKYIFETYLKQSGLSYFGLRFSNLYGPGQEYVPGGEGAVMPIFISKVLNSEQITIFGDGSATRDYLYVDDAVCATLLAIHSDMNGLANIATCEEVSLTRLAEALQEIHGEEIDIVHGPNRLGDIQRSCLKNDRAKELLGFTPMVTIEEGLKRMYDWFRGNTRY
ncbi:MAG: NAD-dependent epimerase/dehydratase family protein [bacterium]|nr:NAD-dependent epimerase/dehydratase family protein [bacterium]